MSTPILATKLYIPPPRPKVVLRSRQIERLNEGLQGKLILIAVLAHQLRRMEARGLITREECVEDNRGSVIRVTDAGRKLATEARLHYEEAVKRYVTDVLTAEPMEALGTIAEVVPSQLEIPHNP
jgi:DNA-binding HxlR family transcriptional regulator